MMQNETVLILDPMVDEDAPRKRILVVDDDADQLEALAYVFRRRGYDVSTAETIAAGKLAMSLHQPQLMIVDIGLPDGDGLALCQQVSDDSETCEIPLIALSGIDRTDVVRQARLAGCQFFLKKPYDPNALFILAENALHSGAAW